MNITKLKQLIIEKCELNNPAKIAEYVFLTFLLALYISMMLVMIL